MLAHSRGDLGEPESIDLNQLLEDQANLVYHSVRARHDTFDVRIECDLDPSLGAVEVIPQSMGQVFLNLIDNACDALRRRKLDEGPGFEPEVRVSTRGLGERVEIRIRDNGPGVDAEVRDRIFDPFFTTKPSGEGTGLGLSITHDIVTRLHGGDVDLRTELGAFTEFRIVLPRHHDPSDNLRERALRGPIEVETQA